MTLSTPLKNKSPVNATLTTPKPSASQLSISSTPFTEGRARRTAATKADKYIDIVSRRLAEVPANGSTPKSMKIASKLISEATPNSRRTILLSQTLNKSEIPPPRKSPQNIPSKPLVIDIPAATPVSVRKRRRAAKIHQMFETSLISLATAASSSSEAGSLSPAAIVKAPSTITKTRLNQSFTLNESAKTVNQSPAKKSQKVSPIKEKKTSPSKEIVNKKFSSERVSIVASAPSVAATPKVPVVEFVAPQSVLRSSKRPRKPTDTSIYNEDASSIASPASKKQAKFSEPSIFPTVSINSQSQVKITPQTPVTTVPAVPVIQVSAKVSNVPAIIVPLTAVNTEEYSSNEDLNSLASTSKRTPLRVQPSRTPTRTKSAIPSLSDYSAATKIAVIEVAKNLNSNANTNTNSTNNSVVNSSATPKVEPWTSKYIQKDPVVTTVVPPVVNLSKSGLSVNIKPVDTSKISGLAISSGTASVPIVPRFPLNLANISNITKSTTSLLKSEISNTNVTNNVSTSKNDPSSISSANVPESPLSRAKRIDLENSSKEEKMKNIMELKKKSTTEIKSESVEPKSEVKSNVSDSRTASVPNSNTSKTINVSAVDVPSISLSSKLPIKPKSSSTVLPSPKVPSRLAEAFSGIDSELPPIDIGLVDDEKILKNVLSKTGAGTGGTVESNGFINPRMKKQPLNNTVNSINSNSNNNINNEAQTNSQLHRTAVLNSAARKVNGNTNTEASKEKTLSATKITGTQQQLTTTATTFPSTPKPPASSTKLDTSSPAFPEILSE